MFRTSDDRDLAGTNIVVSFSNGLTTTTKNKQQTSKLRPGMMQLAKSNLFCLVLNHLSRQHPKLLTSTIECHLNVLVVSRMIFKKKKGKSPAKQRQ